MGGLRKAMPVTFAVWLLGIGALVGIPPLAGFFSKDAVLDAVWIHSPIAAIALFAATLLTGLYSAYATRLAFFGERRSDTHAHESSAVMLVPLGVLAVGAVSLGLLGGRIAELLGEHPEPLSLPVSVVAVSLAVAGAAIGWIRAGKSFEKAAEEGRGVAFVRGGFEFDVLVRTVIITPTAVLARGLWAIVDRFVIDGIVEGSAQLTRRAGGRLSRAHAGDTQGYVALIVLTVAVMLAASVWIGR
jgi:NADH-quinone oxidoreductase subunit L